MAVQATFGGMIQAGRLLVDLDAGLVSVDDQPVHLTGKEYAVLELLSGPAGGVTDGAISTSSRRRGDRRDKRGAAAASVRRRYSAEPCASPRTVPFEAGTIQMEGDRPRESFDRLRPSRIDVRYWATGVVVRMFGTWRPDHPKNPLLLPKTGSDVHGVVHVDRRAVVDVDD